MLARSLALSAFALSERFFNEPRRPGLGELPAKDLGGRQKKGCVPRGDADFFYLISFLIHFFPSCVSRIVIPAGTSVSASVASVGES